MDPRYTAEILKTCESIGFTSEEKYIAEPDWEGSTEIVILYKIPLKTSLFVIKSLG